jgi:dipeptidyl aminopeptidase/acylaminoacyl peptidase
MNRHCLALSTALLSIACATGNAAPANQPAAKAAPAPAAKAAPPAAAPPAYQGHGADSIDPALVAKHAPPPLPVELSRKIQRYMDIRGAGGGQVTSKGDRMVFTWSVTGVPQVWRLDTPLGFPVQLTAGEDRTELMDISPDDRWLVVSRDAGGEENHGLYLMAIEGGPLREILHAPKVRASFAFVSDDARYVYYTANDVAPDTMTLYRWEYATGQRVRLMTEPGLWYPVDHRGGEILLTRALGSNRREIHILDEKTGKVTPLIGQGESVRYEAMFGATPGTLIVAHDNTGDFARLYTWKAGRFTPISPAVPHDVDGFTIDGRRTRIVYTLNEDGYERVHVLDARTYREQALPPLPAADNVRAGSLSRDGRFLTLSVNGATLPSTTAVYDWKRRKAVRWRRPSTPEVDVTRFARASLEHFPARDGTRIPMFVLRPDRCASEPCPVVVMYHGGPEGQARPGFNPAMQLYVDAGFVFVQPNVRGSSGYGKTWLDADNGPKRLAVITDIDDCARFIKKAWAKNGVAPRLGIWDGSYGGYATLMAMTRFAGAYDAGVSDVGPANLLTFLTSTAAYRRSLRASEYGDPEKDRDALIELSPITHVDKVKGPLLIIQGVNDPRVPVGEAVLMYDALTQRGLPAELMLLADEGHGRSKRSSMALSFGHALAFFEKHLK